MKATAIVRSEEPGALALRMRKHFAHKVPVETVGSRDRVTIAAGEFELEARDGELVIRVAAPDEARLARVQEVVGSHLGRFARGADVELEWTSPAEPALEEHAVRWVAGHRLAPHLLRTRDWVRELRPDAGVALRVAALTHDVERDVVGQVPVAEQVDAWDDELAVAAHAHRSAELVAAWLREQDADDALVTEVSELVRLHETGGTEDADILQAADSLAFLETNPTTRWVRDGHAAPERATAKLRWMHARIRVPAARERADSLLERACAEIRDQTGLLEGRA